MGLCEIKSDTLATNVIKHHWICFAITIGHYAKLKSITIDDFWRALSSSIAYEFRWMRKKTNMNSDET